MPNLKFIVTIALINIILVTTCILGDKIIPKLSDYAESQGVGEEQGLINSKIAVGEPIPIEKQGTESRVSISVGETNFYYTANGRTYSPDRISVSGNYYNNEFTRSGYVNLFLDVQYEIYYYWFTPKSYNLLEVYVQNVRGSKFLFEIITPPDVDCRILGPNGQFNATAMIVRGPSRSRFYGKK